MKIHRSKPVILVFSLLVLVLGASACQNQEGNPLIQPEATVTPIPQQVVEVQKPTFEVARGTIVQIEEFTGRVGSNTTVEIGFASEGKVGELYFYEGDMVEEGDLIAVYDNLDELERDTQLRQISVRRAEIAVERAQLFLDQTLENRYASDEEIQLKEWDLELAELSYQELILNLGDQLNAVETAKLISPIDGMITRSSVRVNQIFDADEEIMTISDVSDLSVLVDSYVVDVEELKEGMTVQMKVYNGEEIYQGIIRQMPYPYGTGPARDINKYIYIDFANPADAEGWEINDRFDITAEIKRVDDVLVLPVEAIREFSGRTFVMVEEGEMQVSIDITTGLTDGVVVEILEGLEEGQIVIGQ